MTCFKILERQGLTNLASALRCEVAEICTFCVHDGSVLEDGTGTMQQQQQQEEEKNNK